MADGDEAVNPFAATLKPTSAETAVQSVIDEKHWLDPTLTGANQSVLITAFQGRKIPDGSQVAAVSAAGAVVGLGTVKDGRCGLAVWGDDVSTEAADGLTKGEEFELRLWDAGLKNEIKLTVAAVQQGAGLVYETDGFTALTLADAQAIPQEFFLAEAYPNPFNSMVRLSYGLPENSLTQIRVYDTQGRQVASLLDAEQTAGYHAVTWKGDAVASGMYFVKMEAKAFHATRKVTLVK